MDARFSLEQLRIASPCPASWDEMAGDERARFCSLCQKHVYNFAAMTAEEGLALIAEKEGKLCGRLARRRDGTVLTAECPVGWAARVRQFRRKCVYGLVAAGMMLLGFLGLSRFRSGTEPAQAASPVLEKIEDWVDDLRVWAGLPPRRQQFLGGAICPPPPVQGKIERKE